MEAALRSASHDARLLSNRLERALGKSVNSLPINAARVTTTSVLAEGASQGNIDADAVLQRARLRGGGASLDAVTGKSSGREGAANVEIDAKKGVTAGVGSGSVVVTATKLEEDLVGAAPALVQSGVHHDSSNSSGGSMGIAEGINRGGGAGDNVAPGYLLGGVNHSNSSIGGGNMNLTEGINTINGGSGIAGEVCVDRLRLIAMLAAEERLSAMANHLGSAEPIDTSWLVAPSPSKAKLRRNPASVQAAASPATPAPRALPAPHASPASPATKKAAGMKKTATRVLNVAAHQFSEVSPTGRALSTPPKHCLTLKGKNRKPDKTRRTVASLRAT